MVKKFATVAFLAFVTIGPAHAQLQGLLTKPAKYPVLETVTRLDTTLKEAGMTIFVVIDHAAAAQKAGLRMPPAQVIVFGNPKGGTPMMLSAPTIAIDLPVKILVWEDTAGKVWVSYNAMSYIAARHGLRGMDKQVHGLDAVLAKLTANVVE